MGNAVEASPEPFSITFADRFPSAETYSPKTPETPLVR